MGTILMSLLSSAWMVLVGERERERLSACLYVSLSLPFYMSVCLPDTPQTFLKKLISLSLMGNPLDGAHGSLEWGPSSELSLVCQPVNS